MTKEEILASNGGNSEWVYSKTPVRSYNEFAVSKAMDEYAKQVAVKFKNWCEENEPALGYGTGRSLTTEELFDHFIK